MVIKRVNPISAAKVAFVLYALLGLLFGALFSLFAMAGGLAAGLQDEGSGAAGVIGMLFGVGAIVVLPIVYGCMGAIMMAITALLYNLVAGMVGGLEIDVT
jgi:hypothetical protein